MKDYILLCPNAHRDYELQATRTIRDFLTERGYKVCISPLLSEGLTHLWSEDVKVVPIEEGIRNARFAVTLGGDGTILQASRYFGGTGVPLLGINLGNKGFLAELERGDLVSLLDAAEGRYSVYERSMLDVELWRDGKLTFSSRALNEAVLRATVSVIRLQVFGDGREITEFSGDGVIVSTPTGSTAYSMAAGGPIVEPDGDCLILTPICTFRLAARSYVLNSGRHLVIRAVDQQEKEVMLSLDGVPIPFLHGDELRVKCSDSTLTMANVTDRSFYDIVFAKLNDKA